MRKNNKDFFLPLPFLIFKAWIFLVLFFFPERHYRIFSPSVLIIYIFFANTSSATCVPECLHFEPACPRRTLIITGDKEEWDFSRSFFLSAFSFIRRSSGVPQFVWIGNENCTEGLDLKTMFYNESVFVFFFSLSISVEGRAYSLKMNTERALKKLKRKEINLDTFKVNSGYL